MVSARPKNGRTSVVAKTLKPVTLSVQIAFIILCYSCPQSLEGVTTSVDALDNPARVAIMFCRVSKDDRHHDQADGVYTRKVQ